MKIEQLRVKNFRVFRNAGAGNLSQLNVFVGPNGSGKTTLFRIFAFLSDALRNNVTQAVNREGGFGELVSRGAGPDAFVEIEIKFRNAITKKSPLTTYFLRIGHEKNRAYVETELLKYRRGQRGRPWHFLEFHNGKGTVIRNEEDYGKEGATEEREEQILESPDILAIKGLGQFQRFRAVSSFRKLLEGWSVSDFKNDALQRIGEVGADEHLSPSGANIAQVAKFIHDNHPEQFEEILRKMTRRVPGIEKVEAIQNEAGQILLRFKDGPFADPFVSRYVSDGTLRMFAYLILLYDPNPHPLLCIEEPESHLYPELLPELAEELRSYTVRGGQVFVSTHSPNFLNALDIRELFFLRKKEGHAEIISAQDDSTLAALFEAGNELGWLWQHGYMKGANLR
ncbi:MAG: chromosome segregation protein SMC [Deltaproteobacteria bacterium]|nr:MAG: chromosome segregation protein SMC [Deltaproteobacteria bacterium]